MVLCLYFLFINFTFAQTSICGQTESDCSWEYNSTTKHLTITGNGRMSDYIYNSMPWYDYCQQIITVTIKGVTCIGNSAFSFCASLQSITIPESVTYIGDDALKECKSLKNVIIPNSVTYIFKAAFYHCTSLQSITIQNGVTYIGIFAFDSCASLQNITIPNSVTYIGGCAFYNCTSLQSITLPNKLTSIENAVFRRCTSLQSITIPNSVTSIGTYAFRTCTSLKSVTIPNSFVSIGKEAFFDCRSIESFIIEGYVNEIKERAFYFNGNNYVNFEYHSNSHPLICSTVDPISENIPSINVPKNYGSNVFCSVPIEKTLDETNALYCSYEKESEIYFYAICDECSCPSYETSISGHLCNMGDLINYSKIVVNVTDSYQKYLFGYLSNSFISNELIINLEQQITSYSPFFVFNYLKSDLPLTINSSYAINKLSFYFNMGNSPTRIYGNVDGLKIRISDNLIYNLPRQRTYFGIAINSTTYPHLDLYSNYFGYGISSFGDKFASTSSNVVKVSCGGMYRYYSYNPTEIQINSITTTCNKTFNENDDDDFDSFIVTTKLSLLPVDHYLYLSSSNIIIESIGKSYNYQYIYTYPNMYYKYKSTSNTIIYLSGTKERKSKIEISITVEVGHKRRVKINRNYKFYHKIKINLI